MGFGVLKSKRGFTLMELMIVLIIIAILIAIAIAVFIDIAEKAEKSVLKYNGTYIVKVLAMNFYDYEDDDRFGASESNLNNFLDTHLDGHQASRNKDSIKNPRSGSYKVLHSNSPESGSIADGRNPAVFITSTPDYSFTVGKQTEYLNGTIVTYFNISPPYNVQVYYIDRNGIMDELLIDLD